MPRATTAAAKHPPPSRLRTPAALLCALGFFLCVVNAVLTSSPSAPGKSAAARKPAPLIAGPAIVIDPGHGGNDPGRVSGSEPEKMWTLTISLALAEELRLRGWPVVLTRTDDSSIELADRATFANKEPRRAFISIHFNSADGGARGIETFYAWPREPAVMARLAALHRVPEGTEFNDDRSLLLGMAVQSAVIAATGARDRGVLNNSTHAVTRRTVAPAILVECGFLTNPAELALIHTEEYRDKLVQGLANGVDTWLREGSGGPAAIRSTPALR
jgi:N-acetylmuramoyl-L-alanine amidase